MARGVSSLQLHFALLNEGDPTECCFRFRAEPRIDGWPPEIDGPAVQRC